MIQKPVFNWKAVLREAGGTPLYYFLAQTLFDCARRKVGIDGYLSFTAMREIEKPQDEKALKDYPGSRLKAIGRLLEKLKNLHHHHGKYYEFAVELRANQLGVKVVRFDIFEHPGEINEEDWFRYKNFRIPCLVITPPNTEGYHLGKNLFCNWDKSTRFTLDPEIKKLKKLPKLKDFLKQAKIWNDTYCRLSDYWFIDPEKEGPILYLNFQKVTFEDYYVSNFHLDDKVLEQKLSVREKYLKTKEDYTDWKRSPLENALGLTVFIVNPEKEYGFIAKRSQNVIIDKGFYQLGAGGHLNAEVDLDKEGNPDPYKGVLREISKEFASPKVMEQIIDVVALGIGVDLRFAVPNLMFLAKTSLTLEDVQTLRPPEQYEIDGHFQPLDYTKPLNIEDILSKPMSPENKSGLILALEALRPDLYSPEVLISARQKKNSNIEN